MKKYVIPAVILLAVMLGSILVPIYIKLDGNGYETDVWQCFGELEDGEAVVALRPDGGSVTVSPDHYNALCYAMTVTERSFLLLGRRPDGEQITLQVGKASFTVTRPGSGADGTVVLLSTGRRTYCYAISEKNYRTFARILDATDPANN